MKEFTMKPVGMINKPTFGGPLAPICAPAEVMAVVDAQIVSAPQTVSIPTTKAQLHADATEFGAWATASKWALAALVWAWVKPMAHGANQHTEEFKTELLGGALNASQFAALNLQGLKSPVTVLAHHAMWQWAIDNGHAKATVKGDGAVLLPLISWDEAKDLKENGPASAKVPPAPKQEPGKFDALAAAIKGLDSADMLAAIHMMAKAIGVAVTISELHVDAPVNFTAMEKAGATAAAKEKVEAALAAKA